MRRFVYESRQGFAGDVTVGQVFDSHEGNPSFPYNHDHRVVGVLPFAMVEASSSTDAFSPPRRKLIVDVQIDSCCERLI